MKNLGLNRKFIRAFFTIAAPAMVQQIITFGVSLLDTLMIGGISNEAVSAVYAVNQITFLFFLAISGLVAGAGIFIQQFYGSKDKEHLIQSYRHKILAVTLGLIIMITLILLFGGYLLEFYVREDANPTVVIDLAHQYLPYILISFIPYVFTAVYATSMREIGKTGYPTIASAIAFIVNGVGNYLLIYVAKLGVTGAGIATLVARIVELIVIAIISEKVHLFTLKETFHHFTIEKRLFGTINKKGFPLLINELLWSSGMVMVSLAYASRPNVLAAFGVVNTMSNLFMILFIGLSVGISVMVGNLLGAGKIDEAKHNAKRLTILGVIMGMVISVIMISLSGVIPEIFKEVNADQKHLASQLMIVYFSFVPFFVIASSNFMILRSGGRSAMVLILDSVLMWFILVPLVYILANFTEINIIWLYVAAQSVDIFKAGLGLILIKKSRWAKNLTTEYEEAIVA